jgi:hypothetical protein
MLFMQISFMSHRRYGRALLLIIAALAGCGSDDSAKSSAQAVAGGSEAGAQAGHAGARAASGNGGGAALGSAGSSLGGRGGNQAPVAPDPNASAYQCQPRPADLGGSAMASAACCAGLGVCASESNATVAAGLPFDSCSSQAGLRCEPLRPTAASDVDAGAVTASGFSGCRVTFPGAPPEFPDYEGRCLPNCFVQDSPIVARLTMSTCQQGETCAPCFNPLTGESTGNCELLGDAPIAAAPSGFVECGDGLGYCVPAFAAGMSASQLTQLTCNSGELCAPKLKVADPNACFEHCDGGIVGPGACVPMFLANTLSALLSMSTCAESQVCAPCELFNSRSGVCD